MTVETTIQQMFDAFPAVFCTRRDCYDHLFCVIGNGYEWRRGQLVRCDDDNDVDLEAYDYANKHPEAKQSKENIEKFGSSDDLFSWYPLSEYSKINCVPNDVKTDWKRAVEECKEMMRKDRIEV